jgi:putative CocE/NonD family hydrolase
MHGTLARLLAALRGRRADLTSPPTIQPAVTARATYDVRVPMRDGVTLSADIYFPHASGPAPVILHRTPYNNNGRLHMAEAAFFNAAGYVYVAQDCRGKFDSDGAWFPYRHEAADGDDTLSWCGAQPWSSGAIGMVGSSYAATAQWYAASSGNAFLKCIQPSVAFSDLFFDHGLRRDGALQPFFCHWLATMAGRTMFDLDKAARDAALRQVPLIDFDRRLGLDLGYWREFATHDAFDEFWKPFSLRHLHQRMDVPSLGVAGWHSPFELRGSIEHFIGMTRHAKTPEARRRQRLIIGPWTHFVNASEKAGGRRFGRRSIIDLPALQLRWFARWLKGERNGVDLEAPVKVFVTGANTWRDAPSWPPPGVVETPFYLHSGGGANTLGGDGTLDRRMPTADEPVDRYRYDPEDPVAFELDDLAPDEQLYADRRAMERRADVLVYTTAPLTADLEITGPVVATLCAATSALDTDFVVTLLDVAAGGHARPLTWGVARGRYLSGYETPASLEPDRVYEWPVDLWATSHVFKAGHAIRVEITSSLFPFFGRNHNTGDPPAEDVNFVVATQTVHHSPAWPSRVILPVVPSGS